MDDQDVRTNHGTYRDSNILITGGTGSIGLVLAKTLLSYGPRQIRLLSNDENGLFEARIQLADHKNVVYKLGDVRDRHGLEEVAKGCDFIFHAAALKHVDFCESNPYEAVTTNILGTQNVIESAIANEVKRLVFISTDKAVNPVSTMGATKLLGEKLATTASRTSSPTIFSIVRFGNVFGSRGSVISVFERQVREGSTLTVTNPEMTRFAILPSDAASLVLQAAELARSGEIFVLKMDSVRIQDLAEASREFFSSLYRRDPDSISIKTIGSKPGEKLHEELMTESEATGAVEANKFYVINPQPETKATAKPVKAMTYSSGQASKLSKKSIIALLDRLYAVKQR